MRRIFFYMIIVLFFSGCGRNTKSKKPNILLIIADDLGYTDLGCFGSEIRTPNIDSLAHQGSLFTNFHTGAMCAPSRSTLFTGQDHHLAGWGRQRDVRGTFYEGKWGYENELQDRVLAFPKLLQKKDYTTCYAGKWHIGNTPKTYPIAHGFDESFALIQGAANHWNDIGLGLSEADGYVSKYVQNGDQVSWPSGKYSTNVYTDFILNFLESKDQNKAFFAVASYTAPHWPLQPPKEYKDKYKSVYDEGYLTLREKRFESLKKLNYIPRNTKLTEGLSHIPDWNLLSKEQQVKESRKMELYAAMLEHLDHDIGRLLDGVNKIGELENTIVIFLSDNGADFLDFYNHPIGTFLRENYNNDLENMGDKTSFVSYGPQWAQASMSPYSYYKGYLAEGGVRAPLIVSGPGINRGVNNNYIHIQDLAPSILELTGIIYPNEYEGKSYPPMIGKSFAEALLGSNSETHPAHEFIIDEFQGMASVVQGDFKLLNTEDPSDNNRFRLYNLKNDPGEKINIRENHSQQVRLMLNAWESYKEKYQVVYPNDAKDLNPYKEEE